MNAEVPAALGAEINEGPSCVDRHLFLHMETAVLSTEKAAECSFITPGSKMRSDITPSSSLPGEHLG